MAQGAIQDLQRAANANKRMDQLLKAAITASIWAAFGLQWMHDRGYSIATTLAIGALSGGGLPGLTLYGYGRYCKSVTKIEITETLDPSDPNVKPYLTYFTEAYPWVDTDKCAVTGAKLGRVLRRGKVARVWGDRLFAAGLLLWITGIACPAVAYWRRFIQGSRPWQARLAVGGASLAAVGTAGLFAARWRKHVGDRLLSNGVKSLYLASKLSEGELSKEDYECYQGYIPSFQAPWPPLNGTQLSNLVNSVLQAQCERPEEERYCIMVMRDDSKLIQDELEEAFQNWPKSAPADVYLKTKTPNLKNFNKIKIWAWAG